LEGEVAVAAVERKAVVECDGFEDGGLASSIFTREEGDTGGKLEPV
jgi:hypothetical protein